MSESESSAGESGASKASDASATDAKDVKHDALGVTPALEAENADEAEAIARLTAEEGPASSSRSPSSPLNPSPAAVAAADPRTSEPALPPLAPEPPLKSTASRKFFRYAYWGVWFVLMPLALAALTIWALTPPSGMEPSGPMAWAESIVREQPVPVLIVAFTIFEMALWAARNQLPFASYANPPLRRDLPPNMRAFFDRARLLLEEADQIRAKHHDTIQSELDADARAKLNRDLADLREAMVRRPFDEEAFIDAMTRADGEIDVRLGRFRKSEVREYLESIIIAIVVAMGLRAFVIEAFKIPSGSMIPTLQVGDHIFVNKFSYGPAIPYGNGARLWQNMPPHRGDVMVFAFPEQPDQDFIKRVIALPGDKLEARAGHPIINGWEVPSCSVGMYSYLEVERGDEQPIRHEGDLFVEYLYDESYLTFYDHSAGGFSEMQGPFNVLPGEVYVMGDNRNNSRDSRLWFGGKGGGVPFENIRGRALFVWLSISDAGIDWTRFGAPVMGKPRLPPDMRSLQAPMEKCLHDRPSMDKTTPPPPAQR